MLYITKSEKTFILNTPEHERGTGKGTDHQDTGF